MKMSFVVRTNEEEATGFPKTAVFGKKERYRVPDEEESKSERIHF
jgi:uncharacterized glyoxalase superfamily protein PhnB